jgi:hypothetical protein
VWEGLNTSNALGGDGDDVRRRFCGNKSVKAMITSTTSTMAEGSGYGNWEGSLRRKERDAPAEWLPGAQASAWKRFGVMTVTAADTLRESMYVTTAC